MRLSILKQCLMSDIVFSALMVMFFGGSPLYAASLNALPPGDNGHQACVDGCNSALATALELCKGAADDAEKVCVREAQAAMDKCANNDMTAQADCEAAFNLLGVQAAQGLATASVACLVFFVGYLACIAAASAAWAAAQAYMFYALNDCREKAQRARALCEANANIDLGKCRDIAKIKYEGCVRDVNTKHEACTKACPADNNDMIEQVQDRAEQ